MTIAQINPDKMYTSEQITEYLNVSLRTTQRLLKSGELPSFKIQGQYRIKGIDALNYLSGVRLDINEPIFDDEKSKPVNLINLLDVSPVEVKVNSVFAKNIHENLESFLKRSDELREKITLDLGFICPGIKFSDNENLKENEFTVLIHGVQILKDKSKSVDCIFPLIEKVIMKYSYEIISREEVYTIIEKLRKNYPVVVEEVLSDEINSENKLNIGKLTKILKSLLREKVSIRNMRVILESIADTIPYTQNIDEISNRVRESLSRQICNTLANDGIIEVIGLKAELEKYLTENIVTDIDGSKNFYISPEKVSLIHEKLIEINKNTEAKVIICHQDIRQVLKQMLERNFPEITVLSYREISKEYKVKLIANISF